MTRRFLLQGKIPIQNVRGGGAYPAAASRVPAAGTEPNARVGPGRAGNGGRAGRGAVLVLRSRTAERHRACGAAGRERAVLVGGVLILFLSSPLGKRDVLRFIEGTRKRWWLLTFLFFVVLKHGRGKAAAAFGAGGARCRAG